MVGRLNVGLNQVHLGLVWVSQRIKVYNSLGLVNQQKKKSSLIDKLQDMPFVPYIYSPLKQGLTTGFGLFNNERNNLVSKVVVIVINAESNDFASIAELKSMVSQFKANSIDLFVIGVGNNLDNAELNAIADGDSSFILTVDDENEIFNSLDLITQKICTLNVNLQLNKQEYLTMGRNEFRYFKTSLRHIQTQFIEIEVEELEGKANLFYSFDIKNPISESLNARIAAQYFRTRNNGRTTSTIYLVIVEENPMSEVYFTIQSLNENAELNLKVYPIDF